MKCFYQDVDHNGKGAAALVKVLHPHCELVGLDSPELPWDSIEPGEVIYMVDMALQPYTEMVRLADYCDFHWVDQHFTSIMGLKALGVELNGKQEFGRSSIELLWEYLHADAPVPLAIKLIGAYNRWDHSDPRTLLFHYGLRLENTDPGNTALWTKLFAHDTTHVQEIVERGALIQQFVEREYQDYAKQAAFVTQLDGGIRALAINRGLTGSPILDPLFDPQKHDVICIFYFQASLLRWRFSVYKPASSQSDANCNDIAAKYGSSLGGDFNAANFSLPYIPFKLPLPK
ncbi:conserved hypothetical protein [Gammaproteobacteria bacterium]